MTDIHGRTPASGHSNAILLTEYIKVATDQPNEPELTEFTYTIKVEKDGHQSVITAIRPDISGKIIKVNLAI